MSSFVSTPDPVLLWHGKYAYTADVSAGRGSPTPTDISSSKTGLRKYNNRDRICETALELFNTRGYTSVTTNHISEALGISPGNLYYHFRNKEHIMEAIYADAVDHIQRDDALPEGEVTAQRFADYYTSAMAHFWMYRSLFVDVEELARHPPLAVAQRNFMHWAIGRLQELFELLGVWGHLREPRPSPETLTIVASNTAVILTGWWRFANTTYYPTELTIDSLRLGATHGFFVVHPYIEPDFALAVLDAIEADTSWRTAVSMGSRHRSRRQDRSR